MIEVQHLTKRYGRVTAVDDVTFRVERGEILGFLGPNGAGKTTTMRILTGYMPASEGRAAVAGYDVFTQPLEAKRRTGYLPETPPLYPDMTVRNTFRRRRIWNVWSWRNLKPPRNVLATPGRRCASPSIPSRTTRWSSAMSTRTGWLTPAPATPPGSHRASLPW